MDRLIEFRPRIGAMVEKPLLNSSLLEAGLDPDRIEPKRAKDVGRRERLTYILSVAFGRELRTLLRLPDRVFSLYSL